MSQPINEKVKAYADENNEISDIGHADNVFTSCAVVCTNLFILALVRFAYFYVNNYDKTAVIFDSPVSSVLLIVSLLLVHLIFCILASRVGGAVKWPLNAILLVIETLIVLDCEFNVIVMVMLADVFIFHLLTAIITKSRNMYSFSISMVLILLLFVLSVVLIAVTCQTYFKDTSFSYFKLNALIGGLIYCVWAALFFNVRSNAEFMKASNYSFAISNDLFYIMAEILAEIKVEFTLQDSDIKEDRQQ